MKVRWASSIGCILLSVLVLSSLFVIVLNNASYADAEEQTPVNTATSSTGSDEFTAASGSNRFIVWVDDTPGNEEILFKRSTDNGATWQPVKNLSNNPGRSHGPVVAVSGTNVYVIWYQRNAQDTLQDIFFRRSTDNGATWQPIKNLSTTGTAGVNDIAVSGSHVYVVWVDSGGLSFRRSADSGATWKPAVNLASKATSPQIVASGSNVYVVWYDFISGNNEILLRRSIDNGATWKPVKNLSNSASHSNSPEIAVSGSKVYVVWHEDSPSDIFFRRSTDNGATWGTPKNLSNNIGSSEDPQIAFLGSNVYVAWSDNTADEAELDIHFRRSIDNGVTWKSTVNLSNNPGPSLDPQIAVSGSNVYVTWFQMNIDHELSDIFFRRSTDNGATWKPVINLSKTGCVYSPDLAVFGSNVYVAYGSWVSSCAGNGDIFLERSIDNGATWKLAKNLSNNAGGSYSPQIGV